MSTAWDRCMAGAIWADLSAITSSTPQVSYAISRVGYGNSEPELTDGAFGKNDGAPMSVIWDTRLSGVMERSGRGGPVRRERLRHGRCCGVRTAI